jgi:hypothetical protein
LFRQSVKTRADLMELLDFVQNRYKGQGYTTLSQGKPKMGELQMDWLSSEDLKEEKVVTAPALIIADTRSNLSTLTCKTIHTRRHSDRQPGVVKSWMCG